MASGLKKMLAQGVADEQKRLIKAAASKESDGDATISPQSTTDKSHVSDRKTVEKTTDLKKTEKKSAKENISKNKGGRPTNKERGLASRKQYTLTLKEEDYKMFLSKAGEEEISFAKFMERAAFEYIKNHSN